MDQLIAPALVFLRLPTPTEGRACVRSPGVVRFSSGNRAFLFPVRPDRAGDFPDFRATATPAGCATVLARAEAPANAGSANALSFRLRRAARRRSAENKSPRRANTFPIRN